MTQILIVGEAIVSVGPFATDPDTGDISCDNATYAKATLDSLGTWRIADVTLPADFDLGKYTINVSNVFAAVTPPPAPPTPVPDKVTRLQARLALLNAGKWMLIQPAIDNMTDPQKSIAQAYFDDAPYWSRNDSFTLQLGAAIGLSDADMDSLFIQAATL
jgi:hypothetical protein